MTMTTVMCQELGGGFVLFWKTDRQLICCKIPNKLAWPNKGSLCTAWQHGKYTFHLMKKDVKQLLSLTSFLIIVVPQAYVVIVWYRRACGQIHFPTFQYSYNLWLGELKCVNVWSHLRTPRYAHLKVIHLEITIRCGMLILELLEISWCWLFINQLSGFAIQLVNTE